jgi:hypothetical protein
MGADAPGTTWFAQISGKNVDMNIMVRTYSEAECGIKIRRIEYATRYDRCAHLLLRNCIAAAIAFWL